MVYHTFWGKFQPSFSISGGGGWFLKKTLRVFDKCLERSSSMGLCAAPATIAAAAVGTAVALLAILVAFDVPPNRCTEGTEVCRHPALAEPVLARP